MEYKHDLAAWLERKDTFVSFIFEAPEALEIVEQCMVVKEILLAGDPNKEVLAREFREKIRMSKGIYRGNLLTL